MARSFGWIVVLLAVKSYINVPLLVCGRQMNTTARDLLQPMATSMAMRTIAGLFFSSFLLSIESGNARLGRKLGQQSQINQDMVTNLPGQPKVGFAQYAGYVTVNEDHGRALFYWFFEAASNNEEKPLVLWLNGGPGCSSVGYGATQEVGPFILKANGTGLVLNEYSWNQEANLLFLESPIGVGFSYSNTLADYNILGDNITAEDTYNFLQKWLDRFPTYRQRDFYIAGESYAGKYVPELAELIYDLNRNTADKKSYINLKGFMVGNPETHDGHDWRGFVDYAWSHAVVSDETHKIITDNCDFASNDTWSNQNCTQAVNEVLSQYHEIDMYSLYTSTCIRGFETKTKSRKFRPTTTTMPRMMSGRYDPCVDDYARAYYNRNDVQKALHAIGGEHTKNWSICNDDIFHNWKDSLPSVLHIYHKLIAAGLRIWVYSGDTDGRVSVLSTRYSLSALGLPIRSSWRPWYHSGQVSGWVQEYEGLTFATFKGAGHEVPLFKPESALSFFSSFLSGRSLQEERWQH